MTPEQIRAEYVETLARHEYQENHKGELGMFSAWGEAPEAMRGVYLRGAGRAVDALAEAGLLPIETMHRVDLLPGGLPRQRTYCTPWREVSE